MSKKPILGILACITLIVSCFLNWAWYPDIEKYFTGFFSEQNYYGRPGYFLSGLSVIAIVLYATQKIWSSRLNLILGAITAGYALTSFLRFTSAYDGFLPEKQVGIYIMLGSAFMHLLLAVIVSQSKKIENSADTLSE